MKMLAEEFLIRTGLSSRHKGFRYLADAIRMVREDASLLHNVTKRLYPRIACRYDAKWQTIERDMRILVEKAWQGNAPMLLKSIGYTHAYRPYTREFIYLASIYPGEEE